VYPLSWRTDEVSKFIGEFTTRPSDVLAGGSNIFRVRRFAAELFIPRQLPPTSKSLPRFS
jgi:hypothetical protein